MEGGMTTAKAMPYILVILNILLCVKYMACMHWILQLLQFREFIDTLRSAVSSTVFQLYLRCASIFCVLVPNTIV
jgi:hypothetical protein